VDTGGWFDVQDFTSTDLNPKQLAESREYSGLYQLAVKLAVQAVDD
jgi:hypothetical protein